MEIRHEQNFLKEELASRIRRHEHALEFVDWNESMREKTRTKLIALKAIDPENVSYWGLMDADMGSFVKNLVCGKCNEVFQKLVKIGNTDLCGYCLRKAISHKDVEVITKRERIKQEIIRKKSIYGLLQTHNHILEKLDKIDTETISLEDVQEILEYNLKLHLRCEECEKYSDPIVIIGEYYEDEDSTCSAVCDSCLHKALDLIQKG